MSENPVQSAVETALPENEQARLEALRALRVPATPQ